MSSYTEQIEAQLVVIGGGGSGLAAALAAAEKGLTDILVLEKRGGLGGNTARATGLFASESPTQAREKIIADKDELFQKAMQWAHWNRVNPRIVRAFLNKSGDTIRWLEEKGLEFHTIAFFPNQEPRVEHVATGKGAQLTRVLAEKCQEMGVKLLLHTTAKKVAVGADNQISGVLAVKEDAESKIKTDSVILATGGFSGNPELLKKYCPQYYAGLPVRGLPLAGDGLLMASDAGAAISDFVSMLKEGPRIDLNTWPLGGLERDPLTLWVNRRGERFVDESTGSHPFEAVNAILQQPDKVCYTLLDNALEQQMSQKTPGLTQALNTEAGNNRVKISDSLEDIALWVGADPLVLKSTVDEYNLFCERGYDALFAKDRRYLVPLRTPPFYSIKGLPHLLDTLGGIKINPDMEVLDKKQNPILGLYAAGVATSGWESEIYCSDLSGSAFGYAINSGRIAGENAADFVLQKVSRHG